MGLLWLVRLLIIVVFVGVCVVACIAWELGRHAVQKPYVLIHVHCVQSIQQLKCNRYRHAAIDTAYLSTIVLTCPDVMVLAIPNQAEISHVERYIMKDVRLSQGLGVEHCNFEAPVPCQGREHH